MSVCAPGGCPREKRDVCRLRNANSAFYRITAPALPGCRVLQQQVDGVTGQQLPWARLAGTYPYSLQAPACCPFAPRLLHHQYHLTSDLDARYTTASLLLTRATLLYCWPHRHPRLTVFLAKNCCSLDLIQRRDAASYTLSPHPRHLFTTAPAYTHPQCLQRHPDCASCPVSVFAIILRRHSRETMRPSSTFPHRNHGPGRLAETLLSRNTPFLSLYYYLNMTRLIQNVLAVGGNGVSAFLSWRLSATNACDVTLVWKSGYESVHQYGISFRYDGFMLRTRLLLTLPQIEQVRQRALQAETWYGATLA